MRHSVPGSRARRDHGARREVEVATVALDVPRELDVPHGLRHAPRTELELRQVLTVPRTPSPAGRPAEGLKLLADCILPELGKPARPGFMSRWMPSWQRAASMARPGLRPDVVSEEVRDEALLREAEARERVVCTASFQPGGHRPPRPAPTGCTQDRSAPWASCSGGTVDVVGDARLIGRPGGEGGRPSRIRDDGRGVGFGGR